MDNGILYQNRGLLILTNDGEFSQLTKIAEALKKKPGDIYTGIHVVKSLAEAEKILELLKKQVPLDLVCPYVAFTTPEEAEKENKGERVCTSGLLRNLPNCSIVGIRSKELDFAQSHYNHHQRLIYLGDDKRHHIDTATFKIGYINPLERFALLIGR